MEGTCRIDRCVAAAPSRLFVAQLCIAQLCVAQLWLCGRVALAGGDGEFLEPVLSGTVRDARIQELSGMVPVSGVERHFWIHNDSDDRARLFVVRHDGVIIAEVAIRGASNSDWEDISRGPAPVTGAPCLFVADMGNNEKSRTDLAVYRVPEPALVETRPGQSFTSATAVRLPFRYPDGNFDAEALVVDPLSGDIYVLTKVASIAGVYWFPDSDAADIEQVLVRLGSMSTGSLVTAADIGVAPTRLLVRTYARVLEYALPDGAPFESVFFGPFRVLPSATAEAKSESICYDHDGRGYLTTNEGNPAPIHQTFCRIAQPACQWAEPPELRRTFVRGDVLVEGPPEGSHVDVADAAAIVEALGGGRLPACADRADADDDGRVTSSDALELLDAIARGRSLPPPVRSPGADATTDDLGCAQEILARFVEDGVTSWRFHHDTVPPPPDWNRVEFDDGAWLESPGGVGFGSDLVATRLDGAPAPTLALYARTRFVVGGSLPLDRLVLEIDHDDGFVAFLNGVEVARRGLGEAGYRIPDMFPAQRHSGGVMTDVAVCTSSLRLGENVLALAVHRASVSDPTLYFRAGLRAERDDGTFGLDFAPEPLAGGSARLEAETPPNVGDDGALQILADFDVPLRGWSFVLRFDPEVLDVRSVVPIPGGQEIWSESFVRVRDGEVAITVVVAPGEEAIEPGRDVPLAEIRYFVPPGNARETTIAFGARGGDVPLENRLVTDRPRSLRPVTVDLQTVVTDLGVPFVSGFLGNEGTAGTTFFVVGGRFDAGGLRVRVCDEAAPARLLADNQTLLVTAPPCLASGFAPIEVCTLLGCVRREQGFRYLATDEWTRGDANGDATLDITDPVSILNELFLGLAATPTCPDALDANADERVDLSDAIFILTFLFLGGVELPEPFRLPAPCPS